VSNRFSLLRVVVAVLMLTAATPMCAQRFLDGEYRFSVDLGIGIPGDDFTRQQAQYTVNPFGGASLERVVFPNISAQFSAFGGYLKNEAGDLLLTKFYKLKYNSIDYHTVYYGGTLGVAYTLPSLFDITPIVQLHAGMIKLSAEIFFDQERFVSNKSATVWGPTISFDYPVTHGLSLRAGFSARFTSSDLLDGIEYIESQNDGFSVAFLSAVWTINPLTPQPLPGTVPGQGTSPTFPRGATGGGNPRRPGVTTGTDPAKHVSGEDNTQKGAGSIADGETATGSPVEAPGEETVPETPPIDDLPVPEATVQREVVVPPASPTVEGIATLLDVNDFQSIPGMRDDPRSAQLTVTQREERSTPVRVLFEVARNGETIASSSREVTLRKAAQVLQPMQYIDFNGMTLADDYRSGLPTDEYDVVTSVRPADGTGSSVAARRMVHINYESLFATDAERVRTLVRNRRAGVALTGPNDVVFNTFGQEFPVDGQYAQPRSGRTTKSIPASEVLRDAAPIAPPELSNGERQSWLANLMRESFSKSLGILNSGQKAPESPERLSSIVAEVFFPFDGAQLTDESKIVLDQLAQLLSQHPEINAEIRGFADEVGDDAYNVLLSQRRADRVYEYLNRRQIPDTRIHSHGLGKARFNLSRTPLEEQKNRKVQIVVGDGIQ
jgi:outer membrane protein OmpA-like peptidoglycan-associated protein